MPESRTLLHFVMDLSALVNQLAIRRDVSTLYLCRMTKPMQKLTSMRGRIVVGTCAALVGYIFRNGTEVAVVA